MQALRLHLPLQLGLLAAQTPCSVPAAGAPCDQVLPGNGGVVADGPCGVGARGRTKRHLHAWSWRQGWATSEPQAGQHRCSCLFFSGGLCDGPIFLKPTW